ncbi:MAG: sensor histidine kinase [Georgenia sp.]
MPFPVRPGPPTAAPVEPAGPTEPIGLRTGPVRRWLHAHPWWVDGLVAAAYSVTWITDLVITHVLELPFRPLSQVVMGAVFTVLVLLRRRLPALGVVVVTLAPPLTRLVGFGLARDGLAEVPAAVGDLSAVVPAISSDPLALALLLYAVAVYRRPLTAWLSWAFATAVVVAGILLWSDRWTWWGSLISSAALLTVALLIGLNIRSRRMRLAELEDRARQLALERDQREQLAVSTERNRIAREMHDVVAHSLSVMVTLAEGASAAMARDPEQARLALDQLAETGRAALADTRRMVGVLREDLPASTSSGEAVPLTPQPGLHAVTDLVDQFRATGLPVRLVEEGPPLPADASLQLTVYRIVQESLTNVLRYARLSPRIDVRITRTVGTVVIEVDNEAGSTGAALAGSGKGLIGIRERVAVYDGSVRAGPTPTGWRVRAELAWTEEGR